jgi:hypothetical protein
MVAPGGGDLSLGPLQLAAIGLVVAAVGVAMARRPAASVTPAGAA